MKRISSNIDKTAYAIYLVSILLLSFYIWSPYKFWVWNPPLFFVEKVLIGVDLIGFILGFLFVKHTIGRSKIQFTIIDGLILFYGFYLILHGVFLNPIDPEPIFLYENLLLGIFYICYRNLRKFI